MVTVKQFTEVSGFIIFQVASVCHAKKKKKEHVAKY